MITVYVETKNPGAGLQPGVPFHLAVICAAPKTSFAVVDINGVPVRGSALTSAFRSGNCSLSAATRSTGPSTPLRSVNKTLPQPGD
jgi:hypothetical protein